MTLILRFSGLSRLSFPCKRRERSTIIRPWQPGKCGATDARRAFFAQPDQPYGDFFQPNRKNLLSRGYSRMKKPAGSVCAGFRRECAARAVSAAATMRKPPGASAWCKRVTVC